MEISEMTGRKKELETLEAFVKENRARLIIVQGKKRAGKTFLINSFFREKYTFSLTGTDNTTKSMNLKNFAIELADRAGKRINTPTNWIKAFSELKMYLTGQDKHETQVVFLDNISSFDTQKSGFLRAFSSFWNDWGVMRDNLILVICASSSSWMKKNIFGENRRINTWNSCAITVEPFSLYETQVFLENKGFNMSQNDIMQCYMITGGIPYYLKQLDPSLSFEENIDNMFFMTKGLLSGEFSHILPAGKSSLNSYVKIFEILSKKPSGLSRKEIIRETGLPANGKTSKIITDMANSGFIRVYNYYGHNKRDEWYKLSDHFLLFYFRYIRPNKGRDRHLWRNMVENPGRRVWRGMAFEQICMDHIDQIKKKIGISDVKTSQTSWRETGGNEMLPDSRMQADLMIDRTDKVITICDINYGDREFEITKEYQKALQKKAEKIAEVTGNKKKIQITLISPYGVKKGEFSRIYRNKVTLKDLFESLEDD